MNKLKSIKIVGLITIGLVLVSCSNETKEWDKDNDNIPDYIDIDMGGDIGKSSVYGPINDLSNHPSNLYFPKQSDRFSDADITQNKMLNSRMRASDPFDITGYQTKSVFKAI